jgi:TRAP-type C4-dicarboxylate transport system permease small subunit
MYQPTRASTLDDICRTVNKFLVYVSSFALIFMACMIVYDVFMRYVFNSPLPASVEASELIEPYVVFLPFAFALYADRHVRVTFITSRFPTRIRLATEIFVYLLCFVFFVIICYYSWLEFWQSYEINETMLAAIKLPWWVGKFSMPVGMAFIAAEAALTILRTAVVLKRGEWAQ